MIKEDYVSFETAKLLKEKGFDEICNYEYGVPNIDKGYVLQRWIITNGQIKNSDLIDEAYAAPTLQMAMKWLRVIKGISIDIITDWEWKIDPMTMTKNEIEYPEVSEFTGYYYEIHQLEPHRLLYDSAVISKNRKEACEAAIKYCLENLI